MTGIEGYRLVRRLGAGGMGTVHEAIDADGHRVAVKVIHESISADPAARQRLRREVELLHRVRHDRVARVLDAEVDGVDAFVVTELVEGPTLDEYVRTVAPVADEDLAELAAGLADGLDAIHAAGITHRDLKPGNVMLAPNGPVIIDFGIAQVADDVRLTQTGLITGTPGYLDPDVIAGADPGPDGDWWAWAAVLAFAATGRPPFGRGSIPAVLARVSTGVVDTEGLPEALARALRAALDPEPRRRIAPADLLAVLTGEWDLDTLTQVLTARPPAATTRAMDAPTAQQPRSYAPAALAPAMAATRSMPAVRSPVDEAWDSQDAHTGRGVEPWDRGPWADPGAELFGAAHQPPAGDLHGYPAVPPPWAQAPRPHTLTVAIIGLALGGLAALLPGTWALLLGGLLVLCGALGRGNQRLRQVRTRRGLRRADAARAWLSAPWHLLWAVGAALPGLLIGGIIGVSAAVLTHALAGQRPEVWPAVLWAAALVATALAWSVPPSGAAREGARLLLGAVPRPLRVALALVALAAVGALVTALVLGNVGAPSWDPFPAAPIG
ncbi:serine/threonine-protein kinase [Georgenia sunbinii]|uniref:serine/threonine-protein kinase n=1 Tax=Georgenia sunbinii TaxID=3117728 RepID=UPI002F268B3E